MFERLSQSTLHGRSRCTLHHFATFAQHCQSKLKEVPGPMLLCTLYTVHKTNIGADNMQVYAVCHASSLIVSVVSLSSATSLSNQVMPNCLVATCTRKPLDHNRI